MMCDEKTQKRHEYRLAVRTHILAYSFLLYMNTHRVDVLTKRTTQAFYVLTIYIQCTVTWLNSHVLVCP